MSNHFLFKVSVIVLLASGPCKGERTAWGIRTEVCRGVCRHAAGGVWRERCEGAVQEGQGWGDQRYASPASQYHIHCHIEMVHVCCGMKQNKNAFFFIHSLLAVWLVCIMNFYKKTSNLYRNFKIKRQSSLFYMVLGRNILIFWQKACTFWSRWQEWNSIVSLCMFTGFTGIDSAYEKPDNPEVTVKAGQISIDECVQEIVGHLVEKVTSLSCTSPCCHDM